MTDQNETIIRQPTAEEFEESIGNIEDCFSLIVNLKNKKISIGLPMSMDASDLLINKQVLALFAGMNLIREILQSDEKSRSRLVGHIVIQRFLSNPRNVALLVRTISAHGSGFLEKGLPEQESIKNEALDILITLGAQMVMKENQEIIESLLKETGIEDPFLSGAAPKQPPAPNAEEADEEFERAIDDIIKNLGGEL